jgi:hypothetical protein
MGKHIEYISLAKPSKHIVGSGFAGHLECTYQHLVNMFGEPRHDSVVKGVVAIYDYKSCKTYSSDGLDTEDITTWHIGSKSNWLAADLLHFIKHPKTQEQSVPHVQ